MDVDAINPIEMQYVGEKCDIETAESIVSTVREECEKQVNWRELPSLPLEKIYSFLDRFDRVNMSLVCRKWSEGYSSPSAWKIFRFALMESMISVDSCPGMKFVRKYSSMFRHVDIYYHIILPSQKDLIYIWCRHFIVFLQMLTSNSQLISVKIHNLFWCFVHIDTSTSGDVKRAITSFLGSQRYLKRVEFDYCFHNLEEYMELLKELTKSSRDSITHFGLRGLTICDSKAKEQDSTAADSLLMLIGLPSLTTLAIDYSWIFENLFACQSAVMKTLKNCQTRVKLSKLILDYDSCYDIEHFRGLTSADWQFLKKLYPDLQVELNFTTRLPSRREVEFLIVPDMPIACLNLRDDIYDLNPNDSSLMEIDVLFARLLQCKTSDHLVSLCFKLELPIPDLASTFIPILQACKKLKCLDLSIIYPTSGIDLLFESWLENRPESLKKVFIEISGVEDDHDYRILKKLTTEYVSSLELVGLNVKVVIY
ncbi:hypothetical protein AVEN_55494-1 [Araneus ventricosus]|uniref:F-box domain-containing protein n=1 Tax=Araneus ventricosus TaxID=182803 RepID=A0A4Y2CCC2_ARAVE|nr:hypothetical protein AVEN_55494-1 [Araneus ventricosus]